MPRPRSQLQKWLGRLVLALQQEEGLVAGDAVHWPAARAALHNAELLLTAAKDPANLIAALDGRSVTSYIGAEWLLKHPGVRPALVAVLKELGRAKV
jgi:hypothetical protein